MTGADLQWWHFVAALPTMLVPISATVPMAQVRILTDITLERDRQDAKFGPQRHQDSVAPNFDSPEALARWYEMPTEEDAKYNTDTRFARGDGTWADILVEELAEAIAAAFKSPEELRAELVQVAAVAVAWIEDLDSR